MHETHPTGRSHVLGRTRLDIGWLPWLPVATMVLLYFLTVALSLRSSATALFSFVFHLGPLAFLVLALLVQHNQSGNRISHLFIFISLCLQALNLSYLLIDASQTGGLPPPVWLPAVGVIHSVLTPATALALFVFLPLLYPDGRFASAGWRTFALAIAIANGLVAVLLLAWPGPMRTMIGEIPLQNPLALDIKVRTALGDVLIGVAVMLIALPALVANGSVVIRWRRATGRRRQQLKSFAMFLATVVALLMGVELAAILLPLPETVVESAAFTTAYETIVVAGWLGYPVMIALAIFRHGLYEVGRIVNRALVYGTLTVFVAGLYVLLVGGLGTLVQARDNLLLSVLATGLIAILFQPLQQRVQRAVNRLIYGFRDEPATVIAALNARLQAAADPDAVLPAIVETVSQALKLPYTCIAVERGGEVTIVAETGIPPASSTAFPINYQQQVIGTLFAAPRQQGERFAAADERVLRQVAAQAGPALHAVQLTQDLRRSRSRIVSAREEERRRLRRDLHDGLGPTLASQGLKLAAARSYLHEQPGQAEPLLDDVLRRNETIIAEVRRLVDGLHPSPLDELGLVGALREQAEGQPVGGLHVTVEAPPGGLPPLRAAVEVVAYHIALEALTNARRHARASRCEIRLLPRDGHLHLTISDDGHGLPTPVRPGVGLSSMQERAEEIGGECSAGVSASGGTLVRALLPLDGPR